MTHIKKLAGVAAVFFALSLTVVHGATLFVTSDSKLSVVGGTVNVNVHVGSEDAVNAVQGVLQYPKDIFEVKQVSRAGSIFNIWLTEPTANTSTGEISFLGAGTNSFSGASMPVFTVSFRARGAGSGDVGFKSAAVTAGDGTGANILSGTTGMSFIVGGAPLAPVAAQVVEPAPPLPKQIVRAAVPAVNVPSVPVLTVGLYPDHDAWYNTIGNFLVQWPLPADISDIATAVNKDPQFDPAVSEGLFDNKTFGAVSEGIWYLHVRFKNSDGWGPTAHERIAIDTTPPFAFSAKAKEGSVTEVSAPTLEFTTDDQPSGVAFYRILADGDVVAGSTTSTSFTIPGLSFGLHTVVVQAVDYAKNTTESRLSITVAQPPFLTIAGVKITAEIFFGIIIAVILIGIAIGWWLGYKAKSQRKNRAVIATRDVVAAFGVIQKNIDKLVGYFDKKIMGDSQIEEVKYLLNQTKEQTDKMKRYVSEGVGEIES